MSPLDAHRFRAAEGWLELGDWRSALEELETVAIDGDNLRDVLHLRFGIYSAAKNWARALEAAEAQLAALPNEKQGWINRSFALHELKETDTAESLLTPAMHKFPEEPIIPYNLACYASVLGKIDAARALLERAYLLGDKRELQRMARSDPDLTNLWNGT